MLKKEQVAGIEETIRNIEADNTFIEANIKDLRVEDHEFLKEKYKYRKKDWQLGILTNSSYQVAMKKMGKLGWRKCEPLDDTLIMNKPTVLRRAIDILIDNDILDENGILKELSNRGLTLPAEEIEMLLGLDKGKLKPKNIDNNDIIQIPLRKA